MSKLDLDGFEKLNIGFNKDEMKELVRLAKVGQWAEEHGIPALDTFLRDVSLNWYVQQFSKPAGEGGYSSGVVAEIHNHNIKERAAQALLLAKKALAALRTINYQGDKHG